MTGKLTCVSLVLALVLTSAACAGDLIGWWQFDGDTKDYSGLGNDGAAFGNPTFIAGAVGSGALDFDGDDYVTMDGVVDDFTGNDVTMAAWIKTTTTGEGDWFSMNPQSGNQFLLCILNSDIRFYEGGWQPAAGVTVNDGAWHHIVATREDMQVNIYVDGVYRSDASYTSTVTFSADDRWSIAQEWDGGTPSDFYTGSVDDVRLYDRSLTAEQVDGLFNGIDPIFPKAEAPVPTDGAIHPDTWVSLGWSSGDTAVSHDVYFGDNFDDVSSGAGTSYGNHSMPFFVVGFVGVPFPEGLVPGTTYYWRVDEVEADGVTKHQGDIWSFTVPEQTAHDPDPIDGGKFVDLDVVLSWTEGFGAKMHTVYFGDNYDDVSNADGGVAQTAKTYTPDALATDTVYYWRVDEFAGAITHKGDVWSFATRPIIQVADPNLVGWWKLDDEGATVAVDYSGHDHYGTFHGDPQYATGKDGDALEFDGDDYVVLGGGGVLDFGDATDFSILLWIKWAGTSSDPSFVSNKNWGSGGNTGYVIADGGSTWQWNYSGSTGGRADYDPDGPALNDDEWHHLCVTHDRDAYATFYVDGVYQDRVDISGSTGSIDSGMPHVLAQDGTTSYGSTYAGLIDDVRIYNKVVTVEEIQVAMQGNLTRAWDPSPADNSTSDILRAASLSWSAGDSVSQHAVYFGTDRDAVADTDTSDATGVFRTLQAGASYTPPEGVVWTGGPYYWRIDEHNTDGTVTKGNTWSFSMANYIIVEDFEPYNDIEAGQPGSNLVYVAWADGFDNPAANGSTMGYPSGASMETDTVHGGRQSVPLAYNNTTASMSEVTLTFASQNWTEHDVKTLGLWFHGTAGNTGQLYVKINGSKVLYDGDPADMQRAWQAWNIDLASVGTNLQSVTSLTIGVEGFGATGTLLLDDIRLYALSRESITPVQPDPAALVGHWALDGNVQDSSGLGNHGTANGVPTYAIGKVGQAMSFDGTNDYVAIDGVADDITSNDITFAAWVNMTSDADWYPIISCNTASGGNVGWLAVDNGYADFGSLTGTMYVTDNNWRHLAYTRIGDVGSLYVDGVLEGTHTVSFNFSTSNLWSIGQEWDGGPATSDFFIGMVDDARIYDYGLSYAEVAGIAGRTQPFDKPF